MASMTARFASALSTSPIRATPLFVLFVVISKTASLRSGAYFDLTCAMISAKRRFSFGRSEHPIRERRKEKRKIKKIIRFMFVLLNLRWQWSVIYEINKKNARTKNQEFLK
jgi:hypothetical protein